MGRRNKAASDRPTEKHHMKTPTEVKQIAELLKANGKEAGLPARLSCSTHFDPSNKEWIVGPNFEGGPDSFIFRDGQWFHRDQWSGEDHLIKGGFQEVLADCQCAYTG